MTTLTLEGPSRSPITYPRPPTPRHVNQLLLAAVLTAVECARLFVRYTQHEWQIPAAVWDNAFSPPLVQHDALAADDQTRLSLVPSLGHEWATAVRRVWARH